MADDNSNVVDAQPQDVQSTDVQPAGVEARINQLVAEREAEKRAREMAEQTAQQREVQYLSMLERMAAQQAPRKEEVPLNPELEAVMQRYLQPMQAQFAQMQTALHQQGAQMQYAQMAQGESPAVLAKAQELLSMWKKQGKTGWDPQDALTFARGILGVTTPQQSASQARSAFNEGASNSRTPNSAPPSANSTTKPVEVDRSSTDVNYLSKQAALLEKNLGDFEF